MRPDELYLRDMLEAADEIAEFLTGVERNAFLANKVLRSAVIQKLIVIGEASARISEGLRDRHPEIEWPDIIALRNVVVHAYFRIEWSIIWDTAIESVPELRRKIAAILASEG